MWTRSTRIAVAAVSIGLTLGGCGEVVRQPLSPLQARPQAVRGARAYFARKRRGVYREKKVVEYVPTSERTRIVYVPVTPGGPVPPAEEFVSKAGSKVSHG